MASKKEVRSKEENSYHHGDLRKALLFAAKKKLRKTGIGSLSLRALSRDIGVSAMAPYAHFKDKQSLLQAVASSGYEDLTQRMLTIQKENQGIVGRKLAFLYGVAYIQFAIENPDLYRLMMSQITPMKANAKKSLDREIWMSSQRPFLLLYSAFSLEKFPKALAHAKALGSWSIVHGIASLAIEGHLELPEGMDIIQLFATTIES